MAQSLFNIKTSIVTLSSPPPTSTQTYELSAYISGITKVFINYNHLNFAVKPFKVVLDWPNQPPYTLNDTYVYNATLDSLSTFSPANSALSFTVISPTSVDPVLTDGNVKIYYENGIVHTFYIKFIINSDNIIDMDLNILNIQNTNQPFGTVYNLQSNRDNVVFNSIDNKI